MNMNKLYKKCILLLFISFISISVFAQNTVTGIVSDNSGPLPSATVLVKGTTRAAQTNANGQYSLQANATDVLVFSMLGYEAQEVVVGTKTKIDITLGEGSQQISEVVITALGIEREKKSLGYSLQEVKGSDLVQANEPNLANALSGKVAGLQVVRGSSGPAGSSKIILRGFNSLTGDNQPLIVVDGVPMENFTGASNNDFWNPSPDMGNGLGDINPEDIASMSVLKGASAAALYGSRAGNGVILITTKKGRLSSGLGINYSTSIGFESAFTTPKMQNAFGQGTEGVYNKEESLSWGPKIEGQTVENWNGVSTPLKSYDNVGNYFKGGFNQRHNLSFSQQLNTTALYSSLSYLDDQSQIPGAELKRFNFTTRATTTYGEGDRWTTDAKIQYINTKANNRPIGGNNTNNAFTTMYLLPRSVNIQDFEASTDQFGNQIWYANGQQVNPYWNSRNNNNSDSRDRFLMNGSLNYKFTDWLNGELRAGTDLYTTNNDAKLRSGSPLSATGRYSLGKQVFNETNFSALFSANKSDLFGKWGGSATVGGNLMIQKASGISASAGELVVPNLFSINNGVGSPGVSETFHEKRMNSLFGTAGISYDDYLFLDVTARQDWSTTIKKAFFYPSVSAAWVISDMVGKNGGTLPSWWSYGKVRASYAEVGNDLKYYQLFNTYSIGKDPNGNTTASRGDILFNEDVVNELIKSYEVGAETRFFDGRFGVDFSWYKTNATNQLITLPMNPLSGYKGKIINAGDIQNKGIEIMADAAILRNAEGLNWNLTVNYSHNENVIKALAEGVEQYSLGGFDNISVIGAVKQKYGEIWGTGFRRVTDEASPYFGQLLLSEAGFVQATSDKVRLGNQSASALIGLTNTFAYRGLSLGFQIDGRFGGQIFGGTHQLMQLQGTAEETAPNGLREDRIVEGVVADGKGGYVPNTTSITAQQYWTSVAGTGNVGIIEANMYDATNIRLRQVQLNYAFPKSLLGNSPVKGATVGVSVNNVWMLKSHMNGLDPESSYATGTNAVGFEYASGPTTRSFLINLSVSF